MNISVTVICLLVAVSSLGQHTPEEIRKLMIGSCTETVTTGEGISPSVYKTFYDRRGNDTAYYSGELKIYHKVYNTDESGKITSALHYDKNGVEVEKSEYKYEPDESYTVIYRHKSFDALIYKWFDKSGRLIKEQRDDDSELVYNYNIKGQLIKVMTIQRPGVNGDIEHLKYSYNTRGQRIKEESLGTYRWVKTMFYDAKGVMKKAITTGKEEGKAYTTTITYQYTYWK